MEPGLWLDGDGRVGWCTHGAVWYLPWDEALETGVVLRYGVEADEGWTPSRPVTFVLPRAFLLTEDMCDG